MIQHPLQAEAKVRVEGGKHDGCTGHIVRIHTGLNPCDFAVIEFDPPKGSRCKTKERDAVPIFRVKSEKVSK
ncbi:hypothetical protein [Paraburkholderia ferrariae]|uniref:hypothetical protein n=1 Tax=Paraburkholderia ferrariae TaxID=386056 RepID=UPI000487CEB8|nr:hypothetical protein [Paraburkholderia ferrariae]